MELPNYTQEEKDAWAPVISSWGKLNIFLRDNEPTLEDLMTLLSIETDHGGRDIIKKKLVGRITTLYRRELYNITGFGNGRETTREEAYELL